MRNEWMEIVTGGELKQRLSREPANRQLFQELFPEIHVVQRFGFLSRRRRETVPVMSIPGDLKRYLVLSIDRTVVALAVVERKHKDDKTLRVTQVSIDKRHENQGYGNVIAEAIFRYASDEHLTVQSVGFTSIGEKRFGHIFAELNRKFMQTPFYN